MSGLATILPSSSVRPRRAVLAASWMVAAVVLAPRSSFAQEDAALPAPAGEVASAASDAASDAPSSRAEDPVGRMVRALEVLRAGGSTREVDSLVARLRAEVGRLKMKADHAARRLVETRGSDDAALRHELEREHAELASAARERTAMIDVLHRVSRPVGADVLGLSSAAAIPAADIDALASWIDGVFEAVWSARGIEPAPPVNDAEFLRRVCVDITGRGPTLAETDAFLASEDPARRGRLIDRLVEDSGYAKKLGAYWTVELVGRGYLPDDKHRAPFAQWVEQQFAANVPYDVFVEELITNTGKPPTKEVGPTVFLAARQSDAVANTNKIFGEFMGMQISCAQCHDDPYRDFTQDDYHSLVAFMIRQREKDTGGNNYILVDADKGEARYRTPGGQDFTASMRYYDGREFSDWKLGEDGEPLRGEDGERVPVEKPRRRVFFETLREDAQFARAQVNRTWAQLLGRGLVQPIDGFDEDSYPTVPLVLDALAEKFREAKFDNRWLIRVIGRTRAYALASAPPAGVDRDLARESFASYSVKSLAGEPMAAAIVRAGRLDVALAVELDGFDPTSGPVESAETPNADKRIVSLIDDFVDVYAWVPEDVIDPDEGTLPQALALLNGRLVGEAIAPRPGSTVALALERDDPAERVRLIYRAALARGPRADELARGVAFLSSHAALPENATGTAGAAEGDLLWSLLNAAEFRYNH